MIRFAFDTDAKSQQYCEDIVSAMMGFFAITEEEAVGRVNRQWSRLGKMTGEYNWLYHESPEDWAKIIYYGPDTRWWDERVQKVPQPFP
jgi:hypothetical protein